jgi:predicted PurR-regulated permease PerM
MKSDATIPFYAKASIIGIGLLALFYILVIGQGIIIPLLYSTIIAIVLSPIVNFFVRHKMNRLLAISVVVSLLIIITLIFVFALSSQIIQFADTIPKLIQKSNQFWDQCVLWMANNFNISPVKINAWMASKNKDILNTTTAIISSFVMNTGSVIIVLLLIPVYIFMLLFYQPFLIECIHQLFKSDTPTEVNKILFTSKKIIQSYLVGLLLEAFIVAILNVTSLLIIGVDFAILFGVLGAILNIIPYIGGIIAVALPMSIALANNSPSQALFVLTAYVFIQIVDNNFIIPKVVASRVKINALISIIVVLIGGALWGIPGMFISIPLTAILKVIFDSIDATKPIGYLLGDTMPSFLDIKLPSRKLRLKKETTFNK